LNHTGVISQATDVVGRYVIPYRLCLTSNNILIVVLIRLAFFPLLIASVKGISLDCDESVRLSIIRSGYGGFLFQNDLMSVILSGSLGFTNG
jgi:hypothetical protein